MHDGGETVGNGDDRPFPADVADGLLDPALGHVVQRAGRLVQQQDPGIHQQGAGDGQPQPRPVYFFARAESRGKHRGQRIMLAPRPRKLAAQEMIPFRVMLSSVTGFV